MASEPTVPKVSVVSTGTVDIHAQQAYGTRQPMLWWILASRRWVTGLPVNVYVIEHASGLLLFDAGQDYRCMVEPDYWPGGLVGVFYDRLIRFHLTAEDTLTNRLAEIGYRIEDVKTVVLSHLHFDHAGCVGEVTHADLVTTAAELKLLRRPTAVTHGVLPRHVDLPGLRWRTIEFQPTADPALAPFTESHDLTGDGSLILLPTPGHTPGSMSLLVRRDPNPLLLVGDVTYAYATMQAGRLPGVGKRRRMREASDKVMALVERTPGLTVLPTHDPDAAARLAATDRR